MSDQAAATHILTERAGGVLTLTLNRPDKKNALTRAMYQALADGIEGAGADPAVRCVLIQANGDIFTAGNDLSDFAAVAAGEDRASHAREHGNPLLIALGRATIPLVAAVHGRAVGVGVTLLLHCDLVYVAQDALLTTPFANLALVPEAASSLLLPARIGHARAFEMFVLGRAVDGRTAADWGLANAAVPAAEVRATALAAAQAVAARPPSAVSVTKALMRDPGALAVRMIEEGVHFAAQLKSPEAREAFLAFAEKRAPDFSKATS
jgi:enoyl-CoA hydratase/carnithine racemase